MASYEKPRIENVSGRTITIAHLEQPQGPQTTLTADIAASATSLTVLDNAGFSNTNLILIGKLGSDQCEIKKVNAAVSAGTALTSTGVTFPHSAGTSIKRVLFDQWKIYGTTTNTFATSNLVATIDMQVSEPVTTYTNTSTEYTYYWAVAYDSINTVTGNNSDSVISATAYPRDSVGSLINVSLKAAKSKRGSQITDEWLMQEINDCMRFITGKLNKWSFLESFDYKLGQTVRGSYAFTMPTDIEDPNSLKSILGVHLNGQDNMTFYDQREWVSLLQDAKLGVVTTQALAADTTLAVTNTYGFADSGTVTVYVSGTKYDVTYTGVTRSTSAGVLTGVPASGTGSISVTIPADTNVWQNQTEGFPDKFTVKDGSLYIWPLPDASYDNQNVLLDYFTQRTEVNSASDVIETKRYDAVKHWLIWKIRSINNNASGELNLQDGDYVFFTGILADLVRREKTSQKFKQKPKYNFINYGNRQPPQVV